MIVCITIDADWALHEATEYTVSLLKEHKMPFTFFATHDQNVMDDALCEVAWHPNLLERDPDKELSRFRRLFPNAKGLRPHRIHCGQDLNGGLLKKYGVQWLSVSSAPDGFVPGLRFGTFPDFTINWGDNLWFLYNRLPDFEIMGSKTRGVYIINFYPKNQQITMFKMTVLDFLQGHFIWTTKI